MTQDIAGLIGAVTREVTGREHDGRPARVVRASRTYDTTMDDVWDAITNAERIPRWFLPVSGDLRLGGRYQLRGNASGEITGCNPPRYLSLTWEFGGEVSFLAKGGEWETVPVVRPWTEGQLRSIGLADMAAAIRQGRPHRASGRLALHVLEVMEGIGRSAETGRFVEIATRPERPRPLAEDPGLEGWA